MLCDRIFFMNKILITTAIDYTNDVVHIGHAYQKIVADCLARFYRIILGKENVFFLTGTDEHGGNIEVTAKNQGKNPKDFVDEIAAKDKKQWQALHLSYDRFIRTTDRDHKKVVEEFWQRSLKNGDIYRGKFKGLYCFGCESYKSESEIVEGKCPLHPTKQLQKVAEENYFFRWSKYQQFLEDFYQKNPDFVYPKKAYNEMVSFLKAGLSDITISRSKDKIGWGIPVPGDSRQVIYVWFDALINYNTAANPVGFWDEGTTIVHIIGKDNLRWHALLWPAMLKSAGLRLPSIVYGHGFINLEGKKISKSLGNIIRPKELVSQFGADAARYFFLKYGPAEEDVDISIEKIKKVYNSELANDWGNLVQRVSKLCSSVIPTPPWRGRNLAKRKIRPNRIGTRSFVANAPQDDTVFFSKNIEHYLKNLKIPQALGEVSQRIAKTNQFVNEKEPWKKEGKELEEILNEAVSQIRQIAFDLQPFMPTSSEKILQQFSQKKIKVEKPYFLRSLSLG